MQKIRRWAALLALTLILGAAAPAQARAETADIQAGQVVLSSGTLNVRAAPSTSGRRLTGLTNGSYVTLHSRSGDWWYAEYAAGQFGYCHADYIRILDATAATVTASALNVRTGPGTSHTRQTSLARGTQVLVLSTASGWSRILYRGNRTGYVSSSYLSGSGSSGYAAVALSVPDFKQTDARWASVTLGSSGKTIAAIGCATTGIAMLESHRTGTTIYPDAMAKQLRYTASGSVYWPSHYTAVTSSAGYLSRLYDLLAQGKPVLLGMKKANGSQHWVVVTGFVGGDLTAGNFTIHDPGSASRTRLSQFVAAYPNFYKFFHY